MHKNQDFHSWDNPCCGESMEREGVDKLPERDSAKDGVVGRERLYPDHRINSRGNRAPGEHYED